MATFRERRLGVPSRSAAGRIGELEAVILRRQLATRETLPPNCFLAVNVPPNAREELEALMALDALAQGYYLGRPGPEMDSIVLVDEAAGRARIERLVGSAAG